MALAKREEEGRVWSFEQGFNSEASKNKSLSLKNFGDAEQNKWRASCDASTETETSSEADSSSESSSSTSSSSGSSSGYVSDSEPVPEPKSAMKRALKKLETAVAEVKGLLLKTAEAEFVGLVADYAQPPSPPPERVMTEAMIVAKGPPSIKIARKIAMDFDQIRCSCVPSGLLSRSTGKKDPRCLYCYNAEHIVTPEWAATKVKRVEKKPVFNPEEEDF